MQMKGKVDVNDDAALEKEADVMGERASINSVSKLSGKNNVTQQKSINHGKGCACSSCCTISRKSIESASANSSLVKSAKITIEKGASTNTSATVIQKIQCDVTKNGAVKGSSPQIGKGGVGGVSHAEQKAWEDAGALAIGAQDVIRFNVDGPICELCTAWFENTLYPIVNGAGGMLMVTVTYNEPGGGQYYGSIQVTGPGTVWGNTSEAGYYGRGAGGGAAAAAAVGGGAGGKKGGKKGGKGGKKK
jgi:hypothetical protein